MFAKRLLKAAPVVGVGATVWFNSELKPQINQLYVTSDYYKKKTAFFKLSENRSDLLPIQGPHAVSPVFEQTLLDWAAGTTKKFQLLDFSPDDLVIEVAFLRLLGVERVSLQDLGREKGSHRCFISNLAVVEHAHSVVIQSLDEALNSIEELRANSRSQIQSLNKGVPDPIAHIKPAIEDGIINALESRQLELFYRKMSELSDGHIIEITEHFLTADSAPHKKALFLNNLKKARSACQEYVASLEQVQNSPRPA
jgi:hypothetical protein